jgi:DNA-binding transcriptional ArsR family regulator
VVVDNRSSLSDDEIDRLFRALADRTRRDIVRRTLHGEPTVSQLADRYDMSFAAVQKHVAVLEGAGLVTKQVHGRERLVRGNLAAIRQAQALLYRYEQLWRNRVGRLDDLLSEGTPGDDPVAQPRIGGARRSTSTKLPPLP